MIKPKKIADAFRVSLFDANLASLIIRGRVRPQAFPKRFPKTFAWYEQCFHKPRQVEIKLHALDELLETCGVEAIADSRFFVDSYHGDIVASYLNTGDTHKTTLLLDHIDNKWRLTSWGDFVESLDSQLDDEDNCDYCRS